MIAGKRVQLCGNNRPQLTHWHFDLYCVQEIIIMQAMINASCCNTLWLPYVIIYEV